MKRQAKSPRRHGDTELAMECTTWCVRDGHSYLAVSQPCILFPPCLPASVVTGHPELGKAVR